MNISLHWLRDYASLDAPIDALAQALVDTGTEVDAVHRVADGTIVARVLALTPIEGRTVRFVDIDTGAPEPVRLVTGAGNLSVGDLVPYAPPGTQLPGWDKPLGVRVFFGKYRSPGMVCSAVELGVGDDADGILVLERGLPGQPVHDVLDVDAVLDVEVTPNRPDCLCHLGIARELAAALGESLRDPAEGVPEALLSPVAVQSRAAVRVEDPDGCPRFMVRAIEGLAVTESPAWLRRRLEAVGLRPINAVVDVTNYVAAELGQPLHAFDLDRFLQAQGEGAAAADVVVRRARAGERLLCLDEVERQLEPEDLVVCAGERPVSLAGIIGGEDTAVQPGTRAVLLEAASWDWHSIRASSRRLGVRTDASTHFEKGLSDTLPPLALDRAATLIAELTGGRVLEGAVDDHRGALPPIEPIAVDEGWLERILGVPVDASEAATALARLGMGVEQDGGSLRVLPPHFRRDVRLREDVAEEVGRMLGYARVPATLPGRRTPVLALAPSTPLEDRVRDVCVGAGFDEAITFSFLTPEDVHVLGGFGGTRAPIPLRNPLSEEWSVLRTSTLPGLCRALARNLDRGGEDVRLFELGRAFWEGERTVAPMGSTPDGADRGLRPLPAEPLLLGLVVSQAGDGDGDAAAAALRRLQSLLAWLCQELAGATLTVEPATVPSLRPGRSGTLRVAGHDVGVLGELDAATTAALGMRGRIALAELRVDAVAPQTPRVPRFRTPPRMPATVQDLAVVVPVEERADQALATIREAGGRLLESVDLYDEYVGARVQGGRKGWTFRLTFRAPDRTLSSAEVNTCQSTIADALTIRCQAEVRR